MVVFLSRENVMRNKTKVAVASEEMSIVKALTILLMTVSLMVCAVWSQVQAKEAKTSEVQMLESIGNVATVEELSKLNVRQLQIMTILELQKLNHPRLNKKKK